MGVWIDEGEGEGFKEVFNDTGVRRGWDISGPEMGETPHKRPEMDPGDALVPRLEIITPTREERAPPPFMIIPPSRRDRSEPAKPVLN